MKRFIYHIIILLALTACTDDFEPEFDATASGEPAEITVNLALGKVGEVSRADIAEGLDRKITSIWVATFNASTGARTGVYKATGLNQSMTPHSTTQKVSFKTQSGTSYIVAVANFEHRFGSNANDGELVSLSQALDAATTWNQFLDLSCAFDETGMVSADAPLNALCNVRLLRQRPPLRRLTSGAGNGQHPLGIQHPVGVDTPAPHNLARYLQRQVQHSQHRKHGDSFLAGI